MRELTGFQRHLLGKIVDRAKRMLSPTCDTELANRFELEIQTYQNDLRATGLTWEQIKESVNEEMDKTHG